MLNFFIQIARAIDWVSDKTGYIVSWLTTLLVVLVCFDVLMRDVVGGGGAWIMELEWHFFALIFLFGAAYALKHDRHVRVDLFYDKFSKKDQAWVNLVGTVVFLIPWCVVIIWATYHFAYRSWVIGEQSPDPGGLPALYIIKMAIPVGITLLLLQAFSRLLDAIFVLMEVDLTNETNK